MPKLVQEGSARKMESMDLIKLFLVLGNIVVGNMRDFNFYISRNVVRVRSRAYHKFGEWVHSYCKSARILQEHFYFLNPPKILLKKKKKIVKERSLRDKAW